MSRYQQYAKIIQFQIFQNSLYALDEDGTLWQNNYPPTAVGWKSIPGPTHAQHREEEKIFNLDKDK